jgi:hypothetical protein
MSIKVEGKHFKDISIFANNCPKITPKPYKKDKPLSQSAKLKRFLKCETIGTEEIVCLIRNGFEIKQIKSYLKSK